MSSLTQIIRALALTALGLATLSGARAAGEIKSGPPVGQEALPFTSNFVTGPMRGKQFCYV